MYLSLSALGHEVQCTSIKHDFLNRTIKILSFIVFDSRCLSCYELSEPDMFQKRRELIVSMSNGDCLCASTNQVVMDLRDLCSSSFLPIFSNTQGVDISTKDTVNYKKTGREEATASIIAMIRSCMISSITF